MSQTYTNPYTEEIKELIENLIAAGCKLDSVDNGDGKVKTPTVETCVSEADACDEARVYMVCPDGKVRGLYLVLGNSKGEIVCDYHCCDVFDKVVDAHYNKYQS